jgi:hypothetical protein
MSLHSSILNPVMFKSLTGSYPNWENTLHENRKQSIFKIITYCQRFPKDETIYLQFSSDVSTAMTLKAYCGAVEIVTGITVKAMATIVGDVTRYYFSCSVALGAGYYNKKVTFKAAQDTDLLTSEPIFIEDLNTKLANGEIVRVKYTNLDRDYSDLQDYFVYWEDLISTGSYLQFYIEAVTKKINDSDKVEILEGSQSKDVISSQLFSGQEFETGIIPDYMVRKLEAVSSLDYFEINEVQYIKESSTTVENVGNSTSHTVGMKLTAKNALSINVDDMGVEDLNSESMQINYTFTGQSADFDLAVDAGYMVHTILIQHSASSTGIAIVKAGFASGGNEIIDELSGNLPFDAIVHPFLVHNQTDLVNAGRLYISISGAGVKLNINVNLIKNS